MPEVYMQLQLVIIIPANAEFNGQMYADGFGDMAWDVKSFGPN